MGSQAHHTRSIQRKVIASLVIVTVVVLAVGIPFAVNDDLRLNVARQLSLVPGSEAEHLTGADEDATLVVVPIHGQANNDKPRILYRAQFIGRPVAEGTELTDIDRDTRLTIPISDILFIAADPEGEHVLFQGDGALGERTVVVDVDRLTAETLPEGQTEPDIAGDWDVPIWETFAGLCDRYSPEKKYIACFKRSDAASYLAGDWQIDIQLYGNFNEVEPVFRGEGFLVPIVGFAHDDSWLYFQGETGIWRVEVPENLQEMAS